MGYTPVLSLVLHPAFDDPARLPGIFPDIQRMAPSRCLEDRNWRSADTNSIIRAGSIRYSISTRTGPRSSADCTDSTGSALQGGEFAFVLYAAAMSGGVIDARESAVLTTVVILSMAVTPLLMLAADRLLNTKASTDDVDTAYDQKGRILLIGFGRFGQIVPRYCYPKASPMP